MKLRKKLIRITQVILVLTICFACAKEKKTSETVAEAKVEIKEEPSFKISLAQWSLHNAIREDKILSPFDFAKKAKELGFEGIEYVSQLYVKETMSYKEKAEAIPEIARQLKEQSEIHGVTNVLIMIDNEGDLAHPKEKKRNKAIRNHMLWVDAAATLGCTSVRVNLDPYNDVALEDWHKNSVLGLSALAKLAAEKNINVIVENHGGISSDGSKLAAVIAEVNLPNCGTLPDFGNFCMDGSPNPNDECNEAYDRYKGVAELMPYAKGVSAKSYNFDEEGNEATMDYAKLLQIVKDAGYNGYIGVEYEGEALSEEEGILATKKLLEKLR